MCHQHHPPLPCPLPKGTAVTHILQNIIKLCGSNMLRPFHPTLPALARIRAGIAKPILRQHISTLRRDAFWKRPRQLGWINWKHSTGVAITHGWLHFQEQMYSFTVLETVPQMEEHIFAELAHLPPNTKAANSTGGTLQPNSGHCSWARTDVLLASEMKATQRWQWLRQTCQTLTASCVGKNGDNFITA